MTEKQTEKVAGDKMAEQTGEMSENEMEKQEEEVSGRAKKVLSGDRGKKSENPWIPQNKKYITICKYALVVIALGAVIVMLISQWDKTKSFIGDLVQVLYPFLAALLIAYFLSPLVEIINGLLQKYVGRGRGRKPVKYASILMAYIIVIAFITLACRFVVPQLVDSISELAGNVPDMYNKVSNFILNIENIYPNLDLDFLIEKLNEMVPDLVNFGTNVMGNVIPLVYSLSISLVRLVINIILAVMISVYMISGKKEFQFQLKRLVYAFFDEKKGDAVCRTCRECNDIFSSFLIGKAVDSLIIGCLCCLIMNILRLPYAVLISVVVGITNMIPYFGPFIGAIPGALIYLCISPRDAIVFVIMIFVLQQFDGLVLGPRILGQSTGLGPMWVIFGITVGGAYFGIVGMFIGVPVVAVFAYLINKAIKYRLEGRRITALEDHDQEE